MVFADAESFWKPPNVFDVLGFVGLLAGFFSIWLAVRYAKRDLTARIAEAEVRASNAARDEVRRISRSVLQLRLADAVRTLQLAREACDGRRWTRAIELIVVAREQIVQICAQAADSPGGLTELPRVIGLLKDCLDRLRSEPLKTGKGTAPLAMLQTLDDVILTLHAVEVKMTVGKE